MPTCKKCREHYGPGGKEPLKIDCGHTFCRSCLAVQEAAGPLRCHICKRTHTGPAVRDLAVNEEMLGSVTSSAADGDVVAGGGNQDDLRRLLEAAVAGDVEVALKLIWRGVSADAPSTGPENQGRRPLHLASDRGHENLVWVLLRAGAMVDARDHTGMTALHLASWSGNLAVVTILLMHGADPLLQVKGRSAFHLAAEGGHVTVLRELKHRRPQDLHLPTAEYKTPLHLAADNGNLAAVKWLLGEGADPAARDVLGHTPLDCARQEHQKDVVQYLSGDIRAPTPSSHRASNEEDDSEDQDDDISSSASTASSSTHVYEEVHGKGRPRERRAVSEAGYDMRGSRARELTEGMKGMKVGRAESQREMVGRRRESQREMVGRMREAVTWQQQQQLREESVEEDFYQERSRRGSTGYDDDDDEEEEGDVLGNYQVVKRLGRGDFGESYLVSRGTTTQVLRKVDLEEVPTRTREGLLKELLLLRQISHPHIVATMGGGTKDGSLYLFTEYCGGGTLADQIQTAKVANTPFLEPKILTWSVSLAQALAYLHNRDVMHRDVKPDNLFLTTPGHRLKLGNFSFARFVEGKLASTYIGTPVYMSPQVLQGGLYDTKADMWALGCCLYELATLQRGYPYTQVKVKGKYGKRFKEVVKDLLQKDPAKRPSATELLARTVFQATLQEKVIYEQKKEEVRRAGVYS